MISKHDPPAPPRLNHDSPFGDVSYEFINFKTKDTQTIARVMTRTLEGSGWFKSVKEGGNAAWRLRIVYEAYPAERLISDRADGRPGQFILEELNNAVFGRTFFIFPIYRSVERRMTFMLNGPGGVKNTYSYDSNIHVFFGWSALLLIPWSQNEDVRFDFVRILRQFLADAERDGMMLP